MGDDVRFARLAGLTAVMALPLLLVLGVLSLAAYAGDVESLFSGSLVSAGAHRAELLRWSMIVDMFGYYLILLPLIVLLWSRLQPRDEALARFAAFSGFGYVLVGAIGAAVLAVVDPLLMQRFADIPSQRDTIRLIFESVTRGVSVGLWNMLEQLLLSVWLFSIAALLRPERRLLSDIAIAGGAFALADAVGRMVDVSVLYTVGAVGTVLLPVLTVWIGVEVLRQPATWPARRGMEGHRTPVEREERHAA